MLHADYISTILTWVLFTAAFSLELNNFVASKGWLLRFSVCFLFAGQLAKLRSGGLRLACMSPRFLFFKKW